MSWKSSGHVYRQADGCPDNDVQQVLAPALLGVVDAWGCIVSNKSEPLFSIGKFRSLIIRLVIYIRDICAWGNPFIIYLNYLFH